MKYLEEARVAGLVGGNGEFCFLLNKELACCVETNKADEWEYLTLRLESVKNNKLKGQIQRFPNQQEIAHVKHLFWGEEETVFQIYPKIDESYMVPHFTVALWKPDNKIDIPLPTVLGFYNRPTPEFEKGSEETSNSQKE